AGKPAKIFVMCGVNDLSHNLTTDSIAHDMGLLLERIQTESPSTKIYLQSLLPFNMNVREWKTLVGKEQQTREINARYKEIAERRGITWIDLYPLVVDDNGNLREEFTNDGLHLLGPAYLIWRDAVMPYVKE
ncbi:MAG: sialate O-acetylesterase, partial [Muribaculaceae bacterium]|nr:sialate O-acetylesterase [Muribaculaceae bacterium]